MRDLNNYSFSNDLNNITKALNQMNSSLGIFYGRVSTKNQRDNNDSLETQKKYCLEYANKNNIKIIDNALEAASAKQMKTQKKLNKLINDYDNIQHLVVYSPDRLSRNFYDFIELKLNENILKMNEIFAKMRSKISSKVHRNSRKF